MRVIDLIEGPVPPVIENEIEHFRWARSIAAKHVQEDEGGLRALTVKGHNIPAFNDKPGYIFSTLENPHLEALPFVGELISRCWGKLGGYGSVEKAIAAICKARLQIEQAFLFDSLLNYCYLKSNLGTLDQQQIQSINEFEFSCPTDSRFLDPVGHEAASSFMGPVEIVEAWITESEFDIYHPTYYRAFEKPNEKLSDELYAIALVWLDSAIAVGLGNQCTNLICIASNAMNVASMYHGLHLAEKARKTASANHGFNGARIRHSKTDELKKWAQDMAREDMQLPKVLARRLVHEIPPRLQNASNDPERLIYQVILALRKSNR